MEEKEVKNEVPAPETDRKKEPEKQVKEKKELTPQQIQQRKKLLVYPLMGLVFLGSMYLIFAPSDKDEAKVENVGGFNADVYNQSPGFVFLPSDFNYYVGHCYLKCEPGKTAEIKKMIEKTLQETLPESIHPQVTTLQEDIYEAQATENKLKGIILFFSIVSLLITLLGVYSTITLDTERRQKEVAIRKVNGAGLKQIILLFARLYIRLLTVSAVIAFPLIYIVIQMWKKAYIVFFNDGIIYWAGIFIGITFITALTVLFRILRIARINPAEVIKNE